MSIHEAKNMKRRRILQALASLPLFALGLRIAAAAAATTNNSLASIQQNWKTLLAKDANVAESTAPIQKTEAEWKQILANEQFFVLRKEATERPFTSPLNAEKRAGVFVCAGCTLPLFSSQMKFESGTGWPSFFTSIPGHLATKQDFQMIVPRTEYHCVRCGGHQG
ncbi:MAG: peptide-methionine (R)-S-oxide reductase, partial [Betaproteobacteria bacterium]